MIRKDRQKTKQILQKVYGARRYRPGQQKVVSALLSGRDVICLMPTGAGKSLCFQMPGLVRGGLTVVVSPLLSLMHDQVTHLLAQGVSAYAISSDCTEEENRAAQDAINDGKCRFVYVSPERLNTKRFRALLVKNPPVYLVVDQAHCVLKWGESFRPDYLCIGQIVESLPVRPIICAVTATVERSEMASLEAALSMQNPRKITLPILRKNLIYRVHLTMSPEESMVQFIRKHDGEKGIIYCGTRRNTERIASMLIRKGIDARAYHAGMERAQRRQVQEQVDMGLVRIVCATTAFGMGIDIPDIRYVVHAVIPSSVDDYVQQTGRAGRDGRLSECIAIISPQEMKWHMYALRQRIKAAKQKSDKNDLRVRRVHEQERELMRLLFSGKCIASGISKTYGRWSCPCGQCSACAHTLDAPWIPSMEKMGMSGLVRWWLYAVRKHEARLRHQHPEELLDDSVMRRLWLTSHQTGQLVPDTVLRAEMNRVIDVLQGAAGGFPGE